MRVDLPLTALRPTAKCFRKTEEERRWDDVETLTTMYFSSWHQVKEVLALTRACSSPGVPREGKSSSTAMWFLAPERHKQWEMSFLTTL